MAENKKVYVVGHKNPDTDSICTAIAYANLKTKITGETYEPRRAGQLNRGDTICTGTLWRKSSVIAF